MVAAFFRLILFAFIAYIVFLVLRITRGLKKDRRHGASREPRAGEGGVVKEEQ